MMARNLLSLQSVSRRYASRVVLEDVSLEVREGEAVALIGANGAGKTTFVNMVTGYLKPDRGSIVLDGTDISRHSPRRVAGLGISRSFQIISVFHALTVFENVRIAAQSRVPNSYSR